jgi:hypothetical protein
VERAEALQHREVRAARKRLLAGGHDAALDRLVRGDLLDDLRQLLHDRHGDDVHRAAGAVPGRERDPVSVGVEAEVGQVHRFSSAARGLGEQGWNDRAVKGHDGREVGSPEQIVGPNQRRHRDLPAPRIDCGQVDDDAKVEMLVVEA